MIQMHKLPDYFLNPTHPVTISLIGCGGTGSFVLSHLGAIDTCLKALGHPGIVVYAYDPDIVTEANIGRQKFVLSDIGLNKATVLITRANRTFGLAWKDIPDAFKESTFENKCNIYLSCVDNVRSRLEISSVLENVIKKYNTNAPHRISYYWMDFGNLKDTGQIILGSIKKIDQPKSKKYHFIDKLSTITEMFDLSEIKEKNTGPSCSTMEALSKQDLFINSSLATLGCGLLWQMLSTGMIDKAGLYINLKTMNVNAITL